VRFSDEVPGQESFGSFGLGEADEVASAAGLPVRVNDLGQDRAGTPAHLTR